MAVVAVEGFDMYNGVGAATSTSVGLSSRWTISSGGSATMGAGRFGGQSVRSTDSNGALNLALPANYNQGCVGFAINTNGGGSTSTGIFGVSTNGAAAAFINSDIQFYIQVTAAGQFQVIRKTGTSSIVVVGTSTATIPFNTWNYIEIEFVISDTVGEVRIYLNNDPTPILNLSGINSKGQTASGFQVISLSNSGFAVTPYIDDLYVTDTPNRLGEQRVITSYVDGDVATDYWATSSFGADPYTMLDEATCDADTTYISSNTTNSRAVFTVPSLSVPPTSINAVQLVSFARKTETQLRQVAMEYENSVGAVNTGPTQTLSTAYTYKNDLLLTNPLTGTSWTATDINSMRVGVRLVT